MSRNLSKMFLLVGVLVMAGCEEEELNTVCMECEAAEEFLDKARAHFAQANYRGGISQCNFALEAHPASSEARFCRVVGEVGRMAGQVSELLTLAGAMMPAPMQPMFDAKPLVASLVHDLERTMANLDRQIYILASRDEPTFHAPSVPIRLDVGNMHNYFTAMTTPVLQVDLGGTWDQTQLLLLGTLVNGVQAVLDYGLAHTLQLDEAPQAGGPSFIAGVFVLNPSLLTLDVGDSATPGRLHGDDVRKGLRNGVVAALSYLHGREDEIEGVVAENPGLQEAIRRSAASDVTEPVMKWYDYSGDGHPDGVKFEALSDLVEQVTGVYAPLFPNIFSAQTMDSFYALLGGILVNMEEDGDAVALAGLLENLRLDVQLLLPDIGPAIREVPDLFYVSPADFFDDPLPIRAMLPYFFADGMNYVLLYETKMHATMSSSHVAEVAYYSFAWGSRTQRSDDFRMFPADNLALAHSDEFSPMPVLELADDGLRPDAYARVLPYLGLQSPSFGGLLWLNSGAFGGETTVAPATLASFNTSAAKTLKYYCIDLSLFYTPFYVVDNLVDSIFPACD